MAATATVPDYAWSWLQRSRDVVSEIALRLTGEPPITGFMEALRPQFSSDAFVRDVVIGVVVDVAFKGRVPARRPAGVSWDRGLTWWAAACAGTTSAEFEQRSRKPAPPQASLFGGEQAGDEPVVPSVRRRHIPDDSPRPRLLDRAQVVQALKGLLALEENGTVPAAAVRALLGQIDRD